MQMYVIHRLEFFYFHLSIQSYLKNKIFIQRITLQTYKNAFIFYAFPFISLRWMHISKRDFFFVIEFYQFENYVWTSLIENYKQLKNMKFDVGSLSVHHKVNKHFFLKFFIWKANDAHFWTLHFLKFQKKL